MSISHQDMLEFWPADQLRRWPADQIVALGLAPEAQYVLSEVGLPSLAREINFEARRPRLFTPHGQDGRYCLIGTDVRNKPDGDFSIDLLSGHVVAYTSDAETSAMFVNTTLTQFVESIHALARLAVQHPHPTFESMRIVGQLGIEAITAIDPRAMQDEDNSYWDEYLEVLERGGY